MGVLTNQRLLSMVGAWQNLQQWGLGGCDTMHPHFQNIIKELLERGLIDENWAWTVDLEDVDMAERRLMVSDHTS